MSGKKIATWVAAAILGLAALIAVVWPQSSLEQTATHDDAALRRELIEHRDALRELVDESKQIEAAEEKLRAAEAKVRTTPRRRDAKGLGETRKMRRLLEQQLRDIERELDGK